jgi:hypothetical protein
MEDGSNTDEDRKPLKKKNTAKHTKATDPDVVIVSKPSEALLARFAHIKKRRKNQRLTHERALGNIVPIGVRKGDKSLKRALFASISNDGQLDISLYPVNSSFRPCTPVAVHEAF